LGELSCKERQRRSQTARGQAGGERHSRGAARSEATPAPWRRRCSCRPIRVTSVGRLDFDIQKQIGPPAGGPSVSS